MKLCLFLVAGAALAVQDMTPPVMSMNFPDWTTSRHTDGQHKMNVNFNSGSHGSDRRQGYERQGTTVTCEVGSNAQDVARCPLPNCTIWDHHDHAMKWDGSNFVQAGSLADSQCKRTIYLVNDDGTALASGGRVESAVHRQLRSEWLLEYEAEDLTGNKANNLTFTMVFRDTMAPELQTEFGTSYLWREVDHADTIHKSLDDGDTEYKWLQSCRYATDVNGNQIDCGGDTTTHHTDTAMQASGTCSVNPCVHYLKTTQAAAHVAYDKYDGDVKANTNVTLKNPAGVTQVTGNLQAQLASNSEWFINTRDLGNWTVEYTACDDAGMFGFNQADNCGTQTVTLEVEDTVAPVITPLDVQGSDADTISYPAGHTEFDTHAAGTVTDFVCTNTGGDEYNDCTVECVWDASSCGKYDEPTAKCHDDRDSWIVDDATAHPPTGHWDDSDAAIATNAPSDTNNDLCTVSKTLASENEYGTANNWDVTYSCSDAVGNPAPTKTRVVKVRDTIPPTITLLHDRQIQVLAGATNVARHYVQNSAGAFNGHTNSTGGSEQTQFELGNSLNLSMLVMPDQGVTCSDICSTTAPTQITAVLYHGKHCNLHGGVIVPADGTYSAGDINLFPEYEAGDYSVLYTCHDGAGTVSADRTTFTETGERTPLTASQCRYIDNVDHTRPIIQILGSDDMTLEASHTGNYVDDGAVCSDQVDGVISQNVEVSGDVVNLSKVGTYEIVYNCKDSNGNAADAATRTVHIAQTSCPTCIVTGATGTYGNPDYNMTQLHEASFDYTDAGAACQDDIDGIVNYTTINTVDVETTGQYIVTYRARNAVGLWNDAATCKGTNGLNYYRTVIVVDTLAPVIQVKYNDVVVSTSVGGGHSIHDAALNNPADSHTWTLMAEQPTGVAQGWVIGAVASAVAGVALLVASQRRTSTVLVPV